MPGQPQEKNLMSPAEYLEMERTSLDIKHEFFNGEVFAMVGASRNHNRINVNLTKKLGINFETNPAHCEVFSNDMRVKTAENYTYPDLTISCGDAKFEDDKFDTLTNPVIVIEILSDSTERFDRTKKFAYYRAIPTLQEYILVSQHECWVEQYIRQNDMWGYKSYDGLEQILKLESVNFELPLSEIYLNVAFEDEPRKI